MTQQETIQLRQQYCPDGSNLRTLQMDILQVLLRFDQICRTYDLAYSLCAGTLLGAIRHHGFIPWDDDADVMMVREEYDKLRLKLQTLSPEVSIQIINRKSGPIALIEGNNSFIDIMIVDNAPDNHILRYIKRFLVKAIVVLIGTKTDLLEGRYKQVFRPKMLLSPFVFFLPLDFLYKIDNYLIQELFKSCSKSKIKAIYTDTPKDIGAEFNKEIFDEYIDVAFENQTFRCIRMFDAYLKHYYNDYMQLPQKIQTHNRA